MMEGIINRHVGRAGDERQEVPVCGGEGVGAVRGVGGQRLAHRVWPEYRMSGR